MESIYGRWGFDLGGMNHEIRPGDNFYRYANGRYLDTLIIPPERSGYTAGSLLTDTIQERTRLLLEAPRQPGDEANLAAYYYRSFLDEKQLEHLGLAPMNPELEAIRSVHEPDGLAALMGRYNAGFYGSIFTVDISPDFLNPDRYSVQIGQPDLGLPSRDYYLDASLKTQRNEYKLYVAKLLSLAGWPNAAEDAEKILQFETAIATVSWSEEQRRDPEAAYSPLRREQLRSDAPGFGWDAFLKAAGVWGADRVVLAERSAVIAIAALYARTPLDTVRAWEAFCVLDHAAPYLSRDFQVLSFEFHDKAMAGRKHPAVRWKQALRLVGSSNGMSHVESIANIGDVVAELYVQQYFKNEAREQVEEIVANVKKALHARIESLFWMEPSTKTVALEKLKEYIVEVGYPKGWRSYRGLRIAPDDLIGNIRRAAEFNWHIQTSRVHGPVDRREWPVEPHIVNAYNDSVRHLIVFTAAVLSPPVFDPHADPAVNYGAFGTIVGHELSHGFDDQGRHFDRDGRMRDWWGKNDAERFLSKASKLRAQFDRCEVLPGLYVNGKLTMGENLADLGGLVVALDAYHASLRGKTAPVLDGLTGDQRFFLSYAQQRRGKFTEPAIRQQLLTDRHSPDECRVNTELRNLDGWYTAFGVKANEVLYLDPKERVSLW